MNLKIRLRVKERFRDMFDTKVIHEVGEILEIDDEKRALNIGRLNLADILEIKGNYKGSGKRVVVYTSRVFKIGGIETALYNIAKQFKDRNITFLFGEADIEQALRLAQFRPVETDQGQEISCDVFIVMGYDGMRRMRAKIKAKKIYHQIHADWATLRNRGLYKDYKLKTNGIDRFLSVSETAQKGLKSTFGVDSIVVPNILAKQDYGEFRIFLTLSRLEAEKGGDILLQMLERFKAANKRFLWVICGGGSEQSKIICKLASNPNVILLPSSIENQWLLPKVDYLVQTSLSEAYCYSIHQALAIGTPVISTRIPEAQKVIQDGVNGYLVSFDLRDLDIEKVFENRPKFKAIESEKVEPIWEKVLNGEV